MQSVETTALEDPGTRASRPRRDGSGQQFAPTTPPVNHGNDTPDGRPLVAARLPTAGDAVCRSCRAAGRLMSYRIPVTRTPKPAAAPADRAQHLRQRSNRRLTGPVGDKRHVVMVISHYLRACGEPEITLSPQANAVRAAPAPPPTSPPLREPACAPCVAPARPGYSRIERSELNMVWTVDIGFAHPRHRRGRRRRESCFATCSSWWMPRPMPGRP